MGDSIAAWYPGRVCYIVDLEPGAIIKDEAIPTYLRRYRGATFVTTNVSDFWRRVHAEAAFSIFCLSLPNERLREIPSLLRILFHYSDLRSKAARMGRVVRASGGQFQFYTVSERRIRARSLSAF